MKYLHTQVAAWPSAFRLYWEIHIYVNMTILFFVVFFCGFTNWHFQKQQFDKKIPVSSNGNHLTPCTKKALKNKKNRALTTFFFFPWLIWFLYMQGEGKMTRPELLHRQSAITGIKKGKAVRKTEKITTSPISLKCAMTVVPVRFFFRSCNTSSSIHYWLQL